MKAIRSGWIRRVFTRGGRLFATGGQAFAKGGRVVMAGALVFSSAMAADSNASGGNELNLREEIAVQLDAVPASIASSIDHGDLCVTWIPTEGGDRPHQRCHSLLLQPAPVAVYPVGSATSEDSRVFLPIQKIGRHPVAIRPVLDTGSAGVTLNAFNIFPSTLVTGKGFVFPAGADHFKYEGITVTNVTVTREYGPQSSDPTLETGNLGFAQISFGAKGEIRTALVPILFVYASNSPAAFSAGGLADLIGVNGNVASIGKVNGVDDSQTVSPLPICTRHSTTSCGVMSPFRSISYGWGLAAGYVLNTFPLQDCAATPAQCQAGEYLTLGVTASEAANFNSTSLDCSVDTPWIKNCSQIIPGVQISSEGASFIGSLIFDSGAPAARIEVPTGATFPATLPTGAVVSEAIPSGFLYQFTTGTGPALTRVDQNADSSNFSNTGIEFFTRHSMMLNYDWGIEGWR